MRLFTAASIVIFCNLLLSAQTKTAPTGVALPLKSTDPRPSPSRIQETLQGHWKLVEPGKKESATVLSFRGKTVLSLGGEGKILDRNNWDVNRERELVIGKKSAGEVQLVDKNTLNLVTKGEKTQLLRIEAPLWFRLLGRWKLAVKDSEPFELSDSGNAVQYQEGKKNALKWSIDGKTLKLGDTTYKFLTQGDEEAIFEDVQGKKIRWELLQLPAVEESFYGTWKAVSPEVPKFVQLDFSFKPEGVFYVSFGIETEVPDGGKASTMWGLRSKWRLVSESEIEIPSTLKTKDWKSSEPQTLSLKPVRMIVIRHTQKRLILENKDQRLELVRIKDL